MITTDNLLITQLPSHLEHFIPTRSSIMNAILHHSGFLFGLKLHKNQGHCLYAYGFDPKLGILVQNSWELTSLWLDWKTVLNPFYTTDFFVFIS